MAGQAMSIREEYDAIRSSLKYEQEEISREDPKNPGIVIDLRNKTLRARKAIKSDPVDTLTLSNMAVELAILNQRLGDRVVDALSLARWSKEFYERQRENIKVTLVKGYTQVDPDGKKVEVPGVAAGVADSMKLEKAHDYFTLYNDCEAHADNLVYLRRSTDKTIDTIRTKISYEKADYRNTTTSQ